MDENNELTVGIGYQLDRGQIEQIQTTIEATNRASRQLATGFRQLENTLNGLAQAQDNFNDAVGRGGNAQGAFVRRLRTEVQAGITSVSEAYDRLIQRQQALQTALSTTPRDSNAYRNLVNQLANVNREIENIERDRFNTVSRLIKQETQMNQQAQRERLKAEKERVQRLKSVWQEEVNNYNSIQKQLNAKSSLKDFGGGKNNFFQESIFNSALHLAGIRTLTAEFQNLGREIIDINYNTVNTQRIMGNFSDELAIQIEDTAASIAKATNIQITDAQQIQSAWVRINDEYAKSPELLNKISEATAKFMNVGEIKNAEEAVKLVNATMLQFDLTVDEGIETLNKWAYMADKTAMGTADEYGESMSKIGGYIKSIGGDVDDAIVLTSILGDRLAKSGDEAGNSLKTISAYLTRTKTMGLFDEIAEQTGNFDFSLRNANGTFKEFNELMDTASAAYNHFISQGTQTGDEMAKRIQEALGATRQGDVALTLLQNWDTESKKYYSMINESVSGEQSYLDQQNQALMETFAAQWNELSVSIQEFGATIARSGVLDTLGGFMDILSGTLNVISDLPEPVMKTATAIGMLKGAQAIASYFGNLTGITERYNVLINQGTAEEIENANAVSASANAYMVRMEALVSNNQLSQNAIHVLANQKTMLAELNAAYNDGSITAKQYSIAVRNLIGDKQLESNATRMNTEELLRNANETEQHIRAKGRHAVAWRVSADAIRQETAAENQNNASKNKSKLSIIALNYQKAKETMMSKEGTIWTRLKSLANTQESASASGAATSNNLLATALGFVGTAAGAAAGAVSILMASLGSIISIVSLVTLVGSFFGAFVDNTENAKESLNELQTELDEVKSRIEELQDLERTTGLTSAEKAELEFLEKKNQLLAESIRLKQQDVNNKEWNDNGGFLGFGSSKNSKESLDNLIEDFKKQKYYADYYSNALKDMDSNSKQYSQYLDFVQEHNDKMRTLSASLIDEYYRLQDNLNNGFYSGAAKTEVEEYVATLKGMLPTLEGLTVEHKKLSDSIMTIADETEIYTENIAGLNDKIKDLNDLFDEYNKEGYLSYETVSKLVSEHPEYVKYLVKVGDQYKLNKVAEKELNEANKEVIETTDELIEKLDEASQSTTVGQNLTQDMIDAVDAVDNFTIGLRDTFGNIEGVNKFIDDLRTINVTLLKGESSIDEYNASMNELIKNTDFTKVNDNLNKMDEKTKQVAQSQQAMLTALAQEVSNYMMEITNALFTGKMSATEYVNALQGSNQNILDMYTASNDLIQNQSGQWVDAAGAVNEYANSLQNAINGLNGMSEATQFLEEHQSILADLQKNTAQGMVDATWWAANQQSTAYQAMATDFSNLMANMHKNNHDAWNDIVIQVAAATEIQTTDLVNSNGTITETAQNNAAVMSAFTTATMNTVSSSVNTAASAAGDVLTSLGNMIKNFNYTITFTPQVDLKFSLNNLLEGKSPFTGSGLKLKISGAGGTSVKDFANSLSTFGSSLKGVDFSKFFGNIGSYTPRSYQSTGLNGLSGSNYSPSDYNGSQADRDTAATRNPTDSSKKGKSEAEKAAEEAMKAIEKLVKEYTKNVESMQDRIAKALKKKYQEQYNERKKLLEKEHNERVEQIQAEIDALNGNRPEDKQANLGKLQDKLKQWQKDDSTLGKAKQKELLDQIQELEKEIKLDELNKQLEDEKDLYQKSIDQDSEFYDSILKKLDLQMSDEYLYKEANYLIANNKQQDIIDLLTKYDAQWDGWATLMGQTAGEVIANEVALALANYLDVKNGTITENGGVNTNKVTGNTGTSSSSSSSGGTSSSSSSGSTVAKGKKVKITNGSAGMYYTSTSSGAVDNWSRFVSGQYYVVNENAGRVALSKSNNINGAIGWIDKKNVVALATGGYTGDYEGLAFLHQKERVLSAQQTSAFEHLVYDFMPAISSWLTSPQSSTFNNGGDTNFNSPLVQVNIDKLNQNKEFDVNNGIDNLERMLKNSLQKSGVNLKK